jgi:hypothetical protein
LICATVCSQSANRLAVTTTVAPSLPKRNAMAFPIPLLLPVTIATLCASRFMAVCPPTMLEPEISKDLYFFDNYPFTD